MDKICVFPSTTEQEWQTIACEDGTAIKLWVEPGNEGYVRLQQLAHSDGVGWYVQKSFVVPADTLRLLLPLLRKAACLMPGSGSHFTTGAPNTCNTPLRFVPCEEEPAATRKGA